MKRRRSRDWPNWWEWELDLDSAHLLTRMEDREFNETDLREMLESADTYRRDIIEGRWVIETHHRQRRWEIIVEPDDRWQLLVVVTAYRV
ncbi:MAG: DUF4258 domain-containing protein [Candidatus Hydrogenedentes bacterium]|nr:DUF4258 domain-containing protein [Candidatus Hydrogenedentota bacterium]MBI3119130.1 DUF4258 domain-containing protein [Candidatus Hydrogenedentota bacterium]